MQTIELNFASANAIKICMQMIHQTNVLIIALIIHIYMQIIQHLDVLHHVLLHFSHIKEITVVLMFVLLANIVKIQLDLA